MGTQPIEGLVEGDGDGLGEGDGLGDGGGGGDGGDGGDGGEGGDGGVGLFGGERRYTMISHKTKEQKSNTRTRQ